MNAQDSLNPAVPSLNGLSVAHKDAVATIGADATNRHGITKAERLKELAKRRVAFHSAYIDVTVDFEALCVANEKAKADAHGAVDVIKGHLADNEVLAFVATFKELGISKLVSVDKVSDCVVIAGQDGEAGFDVSVFHGKSHVLWACKYLGKVGANVVTVRK